MNKQEFKVLAARLGFDVGTLEKDYAITALLPLLFPVDEEHLVVFKGGTALNRIHLGYRRLSTDLDFTGLGRESEEIQAIFNDRVLAAPKRSDVVFTEVEEQRYGGLRVKYLGPLDFPYTIRIEVSTRELPMMASEWRKVTHVYGDEVGDVWANVMALDEMISEKIRAAMDPKRAKPRDIIDLAFVEEVEPGILGRTLGMAMLKCESIGQGFGVDLIAVKREEFERRWVDDLRSLLRGREPPDFDETFDRLLQKLETGSGRE